MHFCFVMPAMYPVLAGLGKPTGGSETQMAHYARSLRRRGHRVSVLVGDYGQPARQVVDGIGIEMYLLRDGPSPVNGWRTVRTFGNVLGRLGRLRPDVVVHMNFGFLHGVLASCCALTKTTYVYFTASQADVDGTRFHTYPRAEAWSWLIGMKLCPTVVVQTQEHQAALRQVFGRDSFVIPNGIDIEQMRRVIDHGEDVLWVANWRTMKRPDIVGELASRLPDLRFVMCGGFADGKLYEQVRHSLPGNVVVRGFVEDSELFEAYQNARLLINTSDFEGIPVTFDEAWACELPVVSLSVNPDEIITSHGLGLVSGSIEQMVADIRRLHSDPKRVREIGRRARKFAEDNHSIDRIVEHFENLLPPPGRFPRNAIS